MLELLEIKKQLLEACIVHQKEVADNAKREMKEIQQQANEYGPPKDRYDAFRTQLLRKRDLHAEQYQKALDELSTLKIIDTKTILDKVQFGAFVKTNLHELFIAIGIGKINLDSKTYFVISPHVPIFKAIEGKQIGDKVVFNGKTIEILDIA